MVSFVNNKFENLKKLSLREGSGFSEFKNNTLPKLENLDIRNCFSLKSDDILDEFEGLKDRGTNLKELRIE